MFYLLAHLTWASSDQIYCVSQKRMQRQVARRKRVTETRIGPVGDELGMDRMEVDRGEIWRANFLDCQVDASDSTPW